MEMWGVNATKGKGSERNQTFMSSCNDCNVHLHMSVAPCERMVFNIPEFVGLSCFEIFHHEKCKDLFSLARGQKARTTVNNKHELFIELKEMYQQEYGDQQITPVQLKALRKRKRNHSDNDNDTNSNNNEH
jgi:hypothetical protein